jgi:hypothetical protein
MAVRARWAIPTVADRVAQEVARRYLEPRLEPVFHADSYGYRPGKSAIVRVGHIRARNPQILFAMGMHSIASCLSLLKTSSTAGTVVVSAQ